MLPILGSIYGKVIDLRNALYKSGVFKSYDLGARTISVGNITTGGTGKTPLVIFISEILAERDEKVCILTRGYGRQDAKSRVLVSNGKRILADVSTGGDEPVEIARRLQGKAIVVADANRVGAAKWAIEEFGVTAFVLDDAFQHRRAKRDLDIVCVDATNPFGGGMILPAGRLREPLDALQRANVIVLTRTNLVDDLGEIRAKLAEFAPDVPIFAAASRMSKIMPLNKFLSFGEDGNRSVTEYAELSNSPAFAFTALGNPNAFFNQLKLDDVLVAGTHALADHHHYVENDVRSIIRKARDAGAGYLLTTGKDAVKLAEFEVGLPCFVMESSISIDDRDRFISLL